MDSLATSSVSGTINAEGTALGDISFAQDVEILDTTSEGVAGTVRPSRLSGVTLSSLDVRYYTTNASGEIDRLILKDVTGDLWTYGVLDDVKNLINNVTSSKSSNGSATGSATSSATASSAENDTTLSDIASDVADIVMPSTSELLWGIVDGSISSTLWQRVTSSTASLASYLLKLGANHTTGTLSTVLNYMGSGASYNCYVNGKQVTYQTSTKYPVLAGGIAVRTTTSGSVKTMRQLLPVVIDKLGAATAMANGKTYDTADDMQVYLWYGGTYYATTLSQVNSEDYTLIGWYDANGSAAGGKVRVMIALKKE